MVKTHIGRKLSGPIFIGYLSDHFDNIVLKMYWLVSVKYLLKLIKVEK